MKLKKRYVLHTVATFAIGLAAGIVLEKSYGVKNIIRVISGSYVSGSQAQTVGTETFNLPKEHQGKLQLFILAGQSNMSGMGEIPRSPETNPQIYVFGNDYHWKLAKEPVDDPSNQVDPVSIDKPAGFGPSVAFATTLLKQNPGMVIGLIPCAKGGSLIDEWRRNLNDTTLYGSCLKRVQAASVMGKVAGLLYFQGEIDAIDPKEHPQRTFLPHKWADEFAVLVRDWRRDLNQPDLPVVFAQIGTNTAPERFINWALVKEQQQKVKLPFTSMIKTDDMALGDFVHFTTESYQTIGQRFAEAYLKLLQTANNSSEQKAERDPNSN